MNAGDILLFKGEDGLSKIISWGTDSPYSHVAVCVSAEMHLAIESMPGHGVRARDTEKDKDQYDVFRIKNEYPFELNGVIRYLVSKLNNRYDYLGVFWLGILKLAAKARKPLKETANRWQRERDYFCSELCYEAFYQGGGLDIVPDIDDADITSPADISVSSVVEKV